MGTIYRLVTGHLGAVFAVWVRYRLARRNGELSLVEIIELVAEIRELIGGKSMLAPEVFLALDDPDTTPEAQKAIRDLFGPSLGRLTRLAPDVVDKRRDDKTLVNTSQNDTQFGRRP